MNITPKNIGLSENFDVTEYLERIGCDLDVNPSPRYLKALHRAHCIHIPFENLDNFAGRQIILDIEKIYDKVIRNRRGGFCYELNGLFCNLLNALGFSVKFISAQVYKKDGELGPAFDHMALIISFDNEQYLADVGYGVSFIKPLKLVPNTVQIDGTTYYRLINDVDGNYIMQSSKDSVSFVNEYFFTAEQRRLVEFIEMCEFHNRNPKSHLTKKRFITQATSGGRLTLTEENLQIYSQGKMEKVPVINFDDYKAKLYQHFGIK